MASWHWKVWLCCYVVRPLTVPHGLFSVWFDSEASGIGWYIGGINFELTPHGPLTKRALEAEEMSSEGQSDTFTPSEGESQQKSPTHLNGPTSMKTEAQVDSDLWRIRTSKAFLSDSRDRLRLKNLMLSFTQGMSASTFCTDIHAHWILWGLSILPLISWTNSTWGSGHFWLEAGIEAQDAFGNLRGRKDRSFGSPCLCRFRAVWVYIWPKTLVNGKVVEVWWTDIYR